MIEELCGDEEQCWNEVTEAAILALSARLTLWSTVLREATEARNEHAPPAAS